MLLRPRPALRSRVLLVWGFALGGAGAPATAAADDPLLCTGITDRPALQRALSAGCATVSLGGDLPLQTRAVAIGRSVTLQAGTWRLPPLDIQGAGVEATVVDGTATADQAVLRDGGWFASLFDVSEGASLTLRDTTVQGHAPAEDPLPHALVRQDGGDAETHVRLEGLQTGDPLDHLLLLQHSHQTGEDPCLFAAGATVTGSDSGPSTIVLGEGGSLVGAICTLNGTAQEAADATGTATIVVERTRLQGTATGATAVFDGIAALQAVIDTPGTLVVQESLLVDLTVTGLPLFRAGQAAHLRDTVGAKLTLGGAALLDAPTTTLDTLIFCGVGGSGPLLNATGEAALHRAALYDTTAPLSSSTAGGTLDVINVTLAGAGGAVAPQGMSVSVQNTYIEGSWDLSTLEDATVTSLVAVESPCPTGVPGCASLVGSRIDRGSLDCASVLDAFFAEETALADWPRAMVELPRLVDSSAGATDLSGVSVSTTQAWGCPASPPPRVGAWPGEACGLAALADDEVSAAGHGGASQDSGNSAAGLQEGLLYGCQGRAGATVALLALCLPWVRRRQDAGHAAPPPGGSA